MTRENCDDYSMIHWINNRKTVVHVVGLSGLGGVQSQFEMVAPYLKGDVCFRHVVCSIRGSEECYPHGRSLRVGLSWFARNFVNFLAGNVLIHSYNNATSKKYGLAYFLIRPRFLIYHERGNVWNLPQDACDSYLKHTGYARYVVCNSEATREYLRKRIGVPEAKLRVIYNGIVDSSADVKRKSSRLSDEFVVGYIGRLEPHKGVHSLLFALARIDESIRRKIKILIAGNGISQSSLQKVAITLGLVVDFIGRVSDVGEFYSEIDLLVVPSIREPLGNVIIEAGLRGLPVIASAVDGIPEIIVDNVSGVLIKPTLPLDSSFFSEASVPEPDFVFDPFSCGLVKPKELDPDVLASKISDYFFNPDIALMHGAALEKTVREKFTLHKYFDEFNLLYKEVFG